MFYAILLLLQGASFLTTLDPIQLGSETTKCRITDFALIKNSHTQQLFLAVFASASSRENLRIFDAQRKQVFEATTQERVLWSFRTTFQYGDKLFYFSRILYWVDLNDMKLDSLALKRSDYVGMVCETMGNRDILVANYPGGVHLYDLDTIDFQQEVTRRDQVRMVDMPRIIEGVLVFRSKINELKAYDLFKKKVLWSFSSGKQPAYWLGIKVGIFEDFIGYYEATQIEGEPFIVVTTFFGSIFRIRLDNGEVVTKKERFKGTGNNAGLLTHFAMVDMNGDGITDLVGPSVDHNIYCINGKDFSVLWEFDTGAENQASCSLVDINGDNIPDVFAVNDEMKLSILDGRRGALLQQVILQEGITKGGNQTEILVGDYTGNGRLDIIARGGFDRLTVFELKSVTVPKNQIVWIPGR